MHDSTDVNDEISDAASLTVNFSQVFELAIVPLSSMSSSRSWELHMPQAPKHSWKAEETEEMATENMDDIVGDDLDKVNSMEARMKCAT